MGEIRALVAAAGRGTRAGLPYPKTLHPVQGIPILVRIAKLLETYDPSPTVVVSPDGAELVRACLAKHGRDAHLIVQPEPRGMGDAVLRFAESPAFEQAEHVLLIWGDVPFIQPETVAAVVDRHLANDNDFTLATRIVDSAYTVVRRDVSGNVCGVEETRETGIKVPQPGERDIGMFVFRKDAVMTALQEDSPDRFGLETGEHGFLYIIGHIAARGMKVEALPVASHLDLVSLNSQEDLKDFA